MVCLSFWLSGDFKFVGSTQGSLQAIPLLTNFVMALYRTLIVLTSHMTIMGLITFSGFGGYLIALTPKITGNEPKQLLWESTFWLAFVGLFAYMHFADGWPVHYVGLSLDSWRKLYLLSHKLMPALLGMERAIGGTLMFIRILIFAI